MNRPADSTVLWEEPLTVMIADDRLSDDDDENDWVMELLDDVSIAFEEFKASLREKFPDLSFD